MHEETIVGVDLGSSRVRVAVGQKTYTEDSKVPQLHIVGAIEVPCEGINRGVITNIDDAVKSVSKAIDRAEKVTGLPIESAWVSVNGAHIHSQLNRGIVAVSKTDGEISEDDVERAIEAAKTVTTPPNYEIVHVVPRNFLVDGQDGIKDPVGMTGMRLEVDAYIINGMTSQINNLTKCIYLAAFDIEDLVLNILACGEVALTGKQKELGVVIVNLGSSTTSLAVYEQGDLIHTAVLPIGSEHITSDIAIGLRTSIEVADEVKMKYGAANPDTVQKDEEISLQEFDPQEDGMVSRKYIAEIIEARVEEIFSMIDKELKKIDRSGNLPAGIVLCGGGAKLPGILDSAKKELRFAAQLGYPNNVSSVIEEVQDLSMTCAIGLVYWGAQALESSGGFSSRYKSIKNVTGKMKKWLGSMMP
jgi:cell division protein FtsA